MDILALQHSAAQAPVRSSAIKSADEKLQTVAQDFEAMMLEQMMKSMRKASDAMAEEGMLNSREQKFWRDYQDSQLAMELSRTQGIGLADSIIRQVQQLKENSI